ncbi:MAG TPA: hypothetical protein V6D25_03740 [Leptolyngbyaceae cyanobacterium]
MVSQINLESDQPVFGVNIQSKFMENFGNDFSQKLKIYATTSATQTNQSTTTINPASVIDTMADTLLREGLPAQYIPAIRDLKNDPDVLKAIKIFQDSLAGKASMYELEAMAKPPTVQSSPTVIDEGLMGNIFTGEVDEDGSNDLIRFSDYISTMGGSSFGSFTSGLPSTLYDLGNSILPANSLRRYVNLKLELKNIAGDFRRLVDQSEVELRTYSYHPEDAMQGRSTFNLTRTSGDYSLGRVQNIPEEKSRLLSQAYVTNNLLKAERQQFDARVEAREKLGAVGTGVKGASAAFGVSMGGVNVAAGANKLENAKARLANGEITQAEFNELQLDANLRITEGAFGIADGIYNLGEVVGQRVGAKISAKLTEAGIDIGSKTAKNLSRFAPAAGSAISVGMGVVALTQNSLEANRAREQGNIGRAAMYGICAALDTVSIILDAASFAADFVPGIGTVISFVLDVVNTIVGVINSVIGFFADLVDTRSDEDKIRESFDQYINSDAFKRFIKEQADVYRQQGYDIFQYIVDAKTVGVTGYSDDELAKVHHTAQEALTAKAEANIEDPYLRLALIDASSIGRELRGRLGDDLIKAGVGADTLYGEGGDDLLFGEEGDDTIYGGPGNDFLNGGTGRDQLFGGDGRDWLRAEPGIDKIVDGGAGTDTLEISTKNWNWYKNGTANLISINSPGVKGVYVDLWYEKLNRKGRMGICLGSIVEGLAGLNTRIHKPAFESGSSLETKLKSFFGTGKEATVDRTSLASKMLWFLASENTSSNNLKYFTDGEYIYVDGRRGTQTGTWKSTSLVIANIPANTVSYTETPINSLYSGSATTYNVTYTAGKELEALFLLAFRGTEYVNDIESITEEQSDQDVISQIIGSDTDNIIDVRYGYNESVYTKGGNNVVSMSSSYSPQWEWMNYIIGGNGENTLVINSSTKRCPRTLNYSNYDASHLFVLLDHDVDITTAKKDTGTAAVFETNKIWSSDGTKVDRAIYLKSMQTIQLNAKGTDNASFAVYAINLKQGHTFIINSTANSFWLLGTQGDDTIYVQNLANTNNMIDGYGGKNLLSLEYLSKSSVSINLRDYSISGFGFTARVYNIQSVKGSPTTTSITGNNQDNMLIAYGGSCTVNGISGNNSLVAMRGRHELQGGAGIDTYVIEGPVITELTTITVSKANNTITAQSASGQWSNNKLTISLLANDVNDITLTTAQIVDGNGNPITTGKGSLQKVGNTLVFEPKTDFNNLQNGDSETIRVKYTTDGSTATILDDSSANKIVLSAFSNVSQLRVALSGNGDLEFRDSQNRLIFTDKTWGNQYRAGLTDLKSLIANFVSRFPMIQLQQSNTVLQEKEIIDLLWNTFKDKITTPGSGFDTLIDAKDITTAALDSSSGNNTIYATKKNMTYTLGAGNDLIDASLINSNTGTGQETVIRTGAGDDIVIIADNNTPVKIYFLSNNSKQGQKTLVVKGIAPNQLGIVQNQSGYTLSYSGRTLAILDALPDVLVFEQNEQLTVIPDIAKYVELRKANSSYNVLAVIDAQQRLKLIATDYNQTDITVGIAPTTKGIEIRFLANNQAIYKFPIDWAIEFEGNFTQRIAKTCGNRFKNGIQFRDATLTSEQVRTLILNKLQSTTGHTYLGTTTISTQETSLQSTWTSKDSTYSTFVTNNVTIRNSSFEEVSTTSGQFSTSIPGWTLEQLQQGATYGAGTAADNVSFTEATPEGRNCVILAQNVLKQTLTSNFSSASDYRLTVYLGAAITAQKADQFKVELKAGGTVLGRIDHTSLSLIPGRWHKFVVYVTGSNFTSVNGQALEVAITNSGSGFLFVDQVELTQFTRPYVPGVRTAVTIVNPSFDAQVVQPYTYSQSVTGWSLWGDFDTYIKTLSPGTYQFATGSRDVGDAKNVIQLSNYSNLRQTLSEKFSAAADYELSVNILFFGTSRSNSLTVQLSAGMTVIGSATYSVSQISSSTRSYFHTLTFYVNGQAFPTTTGSLEIFIRNDQNTGNAYGTSVSASSPYTDVIYIDSVQLYKLTGGDAYRDTNSLVIDGVKLW